MSSKNKSQLRTENSSNFPNNNSQFITPEKLRDFNSDMIDSMVANQDSGSFLAGSTGSLVATASFDNGTRLMTFTKGDASTFDVSIPDALPSTASLLVTASVVDATITYTKGDGTTFTNTINNVVSSSYAVSSSRADSSLLADSATSASQAQNATSASHAEQADNATSASNAISSSVVTDPNIAYINKDNTFSGTQNFDNISVSGTGSFGRINTVTGSAKVIGDAFVVVNADTPTLRYAGLQVYDSGSSNVTASIQWDGLNDSWILVEEGGESSFILTGPTGSLGSEANLSNNSLPKGAVHRQLVDSNISDNGTTITLGSTTNVSGPLSASNLSSIEISNLESTASVDRIRINGLADDTGSYARTNVNNLFTEKQFVSGSDGYINQTFAAPGSNQEKAFFNISGAEINSTAYNRVFFGMADYPSFQEPYMDYISIEYYNSTSYSYGSELSLNGVGSRILTRANGGAGSGIARFQTTDNGDGTTTAEIRGNTINLGTNSSNTFLLIGNGNMVTSMNGATIMNGRTIISSSLELRTDPITISSNTASLDFSEASMFELTLVSGSTTHIIPTNVAQGQTVNLLIEQPGTGTGSIEFCPEIFQPTGSLYTPTAKQGTRDILTMITFNNTQQIFVSNVKELENAY